MKTLITQALAAAVLITSLSAFAAEDKTQSATNSNSNKTQGEQTTPATASQPNACQCEKCGTDSDSPRQALIEKQNQQWLHDLATLGS